MKTSHSLLTITLFSLFLTGCQVAKTEKSTQKEPTSAASSQIGSEHATESEQLPDTEDNGTIVGDLDENMSDEIHEENSLPAVSALFTEDDALWTATALETIETKTARLFLPNPNADRDVVLRYKDLTVFGKEEQRVLCGHVRPENSRIDSGKYFPFILEKGESLNISARQTNSAVFEHKWQTNCTLRNGRTVPLSPDLSGLLSEE